MKNNPTNTQKQDIRDFTQVLLGINETLSEDIHITLPKDGMISIFQEDTTKFCEIYPFWTTWVEMEVLYGINNETINEKTFLLPELLIFLAEFFKQGPSQE